MENFIFCTVLITASLISSLRVISVKGIFIANSQQTRLCCSSVVALAVRNLSLDRLQNCALRLVNGQLGSTPVEALRLEANVQNYHTSSNPADPAS